MHKTFGRGNHRQLLAGCAALWACLGANGVLAQVQKSAPSSAEDSSSNSDGLGDIVVTANRIETKLRETPVSVSSFDGDTLKDRQLTSLEALNALVPGLHFGQFNTDTRIAIRGIGNNNQTGGADPGVAFHLDGVYIGISAPAANSFFDLDRVEVLRGPQGTLFGQNATGGTVNLIPNKPSPEFGAALGTTVGIDPFAYTLEGYVNTPLNASGTFSARLSGQRNFSRGFTKNLASDGPGRLDDADDYALRGQIRYAEVDGASVNLAVTYRQQDSAGGAEQLVGAGTTTPSLTIAELLGGVKPDPRKRVVYANLGSSKSDFLLTTLNAQIPVGDGKISIIGSYADIDHTFLLDGDGTAVDYVRILWQLKAKEYYGELLYSVQPAEGLNFILGANAYHENFSQIGHVAVDITPESTFLYSVLFGPAATLLTGKPIKTTTFAAFTHFDYQITDVLQLFGGLRYTYNRKSLRDRVDFVDVAAFGGITIPAGETFQSKSWRQLTYEGGVNAKLSDTLNLYAKYSTGFKGGGFQVGGLTAPPVRPEKNGSLEAGLKGLFLDRTLETNISIFHMKYKDLQVQQVIGFASTFKNAARATINGVEAEVTLLPIKPLRLELSGAYLDAKFDDFVTSNAADTIVDTNGGLTSPPTQQLAGNRLSNAPKFSLNAGAYYSIPLQDWEITLGGRYYWTSRIYFNEFNLDHISQAPVGRVDLSIALNSADKRWSATLFTRNLTDEIVRGSMLVSSYTIGSPNLATFEPGRSIGVSLRHEF